MPEPKKEPKKAQCPECETESVLGEDCPKCGLDVEGFISFRRVFKLNATLDEKERHAKQLEDEKKNSEEKLKERGRGRFWPRGGKDNA